MRISALPSHPSLSKPHVNARFLPTPIEQDAVEEGNPTRLRKLCVKAETFSGTDLDEYLSAKRSLENALAAELEMKARRILLERGVPADRCNVRLD